MKYSDFVDYSKIDSLKVLAQRVAKKTTQNLSLAGFTEVGASRGESAYVVDCGNLYFASITECLGTKALVADETRKITGKTYYDSIAQDTIAMAVNDIISVGARPLSIHAYWAAGSSEWFKNKQRMKDLVKGWEKACNLSGASWGGGETSVLKGVVCPSSIDLAASCIGIVKPKKHLTLGDRLKAGDVIVFLESSGIHANGLTMARKLADKLPKGYATKISDGSMYGEALLRPTIIYARVIRALFDNNIDIHYLVNITGHGWRKIMRCSKPFTYQIAEIPPIPPVLKFIVETGQVKTSEAYGSFNMGVGLAVFVPEKDVKRTLLVSQKTGIRAYTAGEVKKGQKQVIVEPLKIVFKGASLKLRG